MSDGSEAATCGFEAVSTGFRAVSTGFEAVSTGFEAAGMTIGFEAAWDGFETASTGLETTFGTFWAEPYGFVLKVTTVLAIEAKFTQWTNHYCNVQNSGKCYL